MNLALNYLTLLLADPDAPPIDIQAFFPPLTEMSHYRTDHRWVRDHQFEHRFRFPHFDGGKTEASMNIHVVWNNIELLGMTYKDRNVWSTLVDDGWNRRLHVSRYLCAPPSFVLHNLGGYFYAAFESNFNRHNYGDSADARDLARSNFWAFSNSIYYWFVFTRWCHLVFHGVVFRCFEYPGLRANHDRFRGVLAPLLLEILDWINGWESVIYFVAQP